MILTLSRAFIITQAGLIMTAAASTSNNTLGTLPNFTDIIHKIGPNLTSLIDAEIDLAMQEVERVEAIGDDRTWSNTVEPLEAAQTRLSNFMSPISHLNAVANSDTLRQIYDQAIIQLTEMYDHIGQSQTLYKAYVEIQQHAKHHALSPAQIRVLELAIRDFKLSGVNLNDQAKEKLKGINKKLADTSFVLIE